MSPEAAFAKVSDALPFIESSPIGRAESQRQPEPGSGLDAYRAALNWAKQDVPPDNGLCEKAKQEIWEAPSVISELFLALQSSTQFIFLFFPKIQQALTIFSAKKPRQSWGEGGGTKKGVNSLA